MLYSVIFFTTSGDAGQESFSSFPKATAFENRMLDHGYTASGVLGGMSEEEQDACGYPFSGLTLTDEDCFVPDEELDARISF